LEILEKVLRVILQITQSCRRGRERATKRFLHARVVGRIKTDGQDPFTDARKKVQAYIDDMVVTSSERG